MKSLAEDVAAERSISAALSAKSNAVGRVMTEMAQVALAGSSQGSTHARPETFASNADAATACAPQRCMEAAHSRLLPLSLSQRKFDRPKLYRAVLPRHVSGLEKGFTVLRGGSLELWHGID